MSSPSINTQSRPVDVLILAAGLGTRMKSNLAKVLHKLDGRPLIAHVVRTAATLQPRKIYVVVGHQAEQVQAAVTGDAGTEGVEFLNQVEQRGTGDALLTAKDALAKAHSTVLVLSGDVPLVRADTLKKLLDTHTDRKS